ncbi:unnamed protein product, partial [Mesorhabditis belari]|uniref:F-box domain-containing protein n=1 Tax=Mesorhabditis belari TaxID=2138241 RepID=A0AAF3ELJ1_9BILA
MLGFKFRKLVLFLKGEKQKRTKTITTKEKRNRSSSGKEVELPDSVWQKIFDHSSPYDVAQWRGVSKNLDTIIKKRYETILYLDVWRMNLNELLPAPYDNDGDFFRHPSANLLMHVEAHSAIIVIHHEWSLKDVVKLWQGLQAFRSTAQTIMLDASVFELTMAGLALRDISRWFNFMCSLTRSKEEDRIVLKTKPGRFADEPFFPKVKELTIRTTYPELKQLRRVPEYGVPTNHLFNEGTIQLLRLNIANGKHTTTPSHTRYTPFLIRFKRWLNTSSMGEKYCQQYS